MICSPAVIANVFRGQEHTYIYATRRHCKLTNSLCFCFTSHHAITSICCNFLGASRSFIKHGALQNFLQR